VKCPVCNSENVMDGLLVSNYGLTFTVKGTENKLRPKAYRVEAKACGDCGKLFDLYIISTGKNKLGKDQ